MPRANSITYGNYWSSPYGSIQNRNLYYVNPRLNEQKTPLTSLKGIINPGPKINSYGNLWYPHMFIDLNYNPKTGGYSNSNGPIGPYFAQGLGNYPRSMFKETKFGNKKKNKKNNKK